MSPYIWMTLSLQIVDQIGQKKNNTTELTRVKSFQHAAFGVLIQTFQTIKLEPSFKISGPVITCNMVVLSCHSLYEGVKAFRI